MHKYLYILGLCATAHISAGTLTCNEPLPAEAKRVYTLLAAGYTFTPEAIAKNTAQPIDAIRIVHDDNGQEIERRSVTFTFDELLRAHMASSLERIRLRLLMPLNVIHISPHARDPHDLLAAQIAFWGKIDPALMADVPALPSGIVGHLEIAPALGAGHDQMRWYFQVPTADSPTPYIAYGETCHVIYPVHSSQERAAVIRRILPQFIDAAVCTSPDQLVLTDASKQKMAGTESPEAFLKDYDRAYLREQYKHQLLPADMSDLFDKMADIVISDLDANDQLTKIE